MLNFQDILILVMNQVSIPLDNSHPAARTRHGLRKLEANTATSKDKEMFQNPIQLERFDLDQRI